MEEGKERVVAVVESRTEQQDEEMRHQRRQPLGKKLRRQLLGQRSGRPKMEKSVCGVVIMSLIALDDREDCFGEGNL